MKRLKNGKVNVGQSRSDAVRYEQMFREYNKGYSEQSTKRRLRSEATSKVNIGKIHHARV